MCEIVMALLFLLGIPLVVNFYRFFLPAVKHHKSWRATWADWEREVEQLFGE